MAETRAYAESDGTDPALFEVPWGSYRPKPVQAALIALTRRSFLQRGKLRQIMSRLITGLGAPLDITFRGCRFRIEGRNNLIEWGLLTRPSYNAVEIDFLCEGLPPGGVGIDIGCNVGLYSLPLAMAAGAQGKLLAIDANAGMIQHLSFHAQASELPQIIPINLAVGDHEAQVDLRILKDDVAIVSVAESEGGGITMQPLAQIVANAGVSHVDVLKIDIEGHEDAALVPYLDSVEDALRPKRIVIEKIGPAEDYPGCTAAFARHGYRLVTRTRNNSLYRKDA